MLPNDEDRILMYEKRRNYYRSQLLLQPDDIKFSDFRHMIRHLRPLQRHFRYVVRLDSDGPRLIDFSYTDSASDFKQMKSDFKQLESEYSLSPLYKLFRKFPITPQHQLLKGTLKLYQKGLDEIFYGYYQEFWTIESIDLKHDRIKFTRTPAI